MKSKFAELNKILSWNFKVLLNTRITKEFKRLLFRVSVALGVVTVIIILQGTALWYVSDGKEANITSPGEGMYFIVVSTFGETNAPTSFYARLLMLVGLFEGLILATYLIAVAAFFTIKGGRIMTRKHSAHIIICGWNFQGPRIIQELLGARTKNKFDIVVIPGDESVDIKSFGRNVFKVSGPATEDEVLLSADIPTAKSAIILTDTSLTPNNADAKVLMITLALETLNPSVYTCAQIMNSENAVHLKRANVDELILFDVIGANLSVASALSPGITRMVSELIHFDDGSELYKLPPPIPLELSGKTFNEAAIWFRKLDMILIGVESDNLVDSYSATRITDENAYAFHNPHKGVYVNPKDHMLNKNDALFVIAEDSPELIIQTNK